MLQVPGMVAHPGGYRDMPTIANQFFADMGTDKASASQNHNFFHMSNLPGCACTFLSKVMDICELFFANTLNLAT